MSTTCQHVLALIDNFDAWFDIYQEYEGVLALCDSVQMPAELNVASKDALVAYVGAAWCKMVAADVRHLLPSGLQILDESRAAATTLRESLSGPEQEQRYSSLIAAYAVARWHDAAGKLCYRVGDYTQARELTRIALGMAELHKLDRCRFDIASNGIRSGVEERKPGGQGGEIDEEVTKVYQSQLDDAFAALANMDGSLAQAFQSLNEPVRKLQELARHATTEQRELLRGICSLLHNFSTEAVGGNQRSRRLGYSKHSEIIAKALGDQYRLGQALNQQALQQRQENPRLAQCLWFQVRDDIHWIRGRLFARQNLAMLDSEVPLHGQGLRDFLAQRLRTLFELIDEIQERGKSGDIQALDVDLYGWTVRYAFQRFEQLQKSVGDGQGGASATEIKAYSDRMYQELSQMVRGYRSVVKVTIYKFAFAKHFAWAYDKLIGHDLAAGHPSDAFAWSEESRCRDLLDMLAKKSGPATGLATDDGAFSVDAPPSVKSSAAVQTTRRLQLEGDEDGKIRGAVLDSYRRFEEFAKKNTNRAVEIEQHIYDRCREFTDRNSTVILSFFATKRDAKTNAPTEYGVFRFCGGQADIRTGITIAASLASLDKFLDFCQPGKVNGDDYRQRLQEWCCQIGVEVMDKALEGLELSTEAALVVIPTEQIWRLPLHVAVVNNTPLAVQRPTYYSVSATALIDYGRYDRQWTEVSVDSKFALLATTDNRKALFGKKTIEALADELGEALAKRARVAGPGRLWEGIQYAPQINVGLSNLDGLKECIAFEPNWLIIEGHGSYVQDKQVAHAYLSMPDEPGKVVTPYDVAMLPSMGNIHLAILAACLSGRGADLDGGEVSGFLRALIAKDVGCCGLALWPVHDRDTTWFTTTIVKLLAGVQGSVRVTRLFHDMYRAAHDPKDLGATISRCCFGLYL